MLVLVSHLSFRRRYRGPALPVRMPFFPWMQYAGLAMLAGILVTMGLDPTLDVSWLYGVPWVVLISLAYFVRRARQTQESSG
jgi:L-asparagine transporter-like permease